MLDNFKNEELIQATSLKLKLSQFAVEKDLFVTKAIATLIAVEDDVFKLVFQGGTALAKAHGFVQRMSEDCDFRLTYKVSTESHKKDVKRKLLRTFRKNLLAALTDNQFELDENSVTVRNEGQFITIRVRYPSVYSAPAGLKPYLALEFFLGEVKTPTVSCSITSLIRQTLGERVDHPTIQVNCMSIPETASEKWVALTRRVATAEQKDHYYDQALVRHIYDLVMINRHCPLKETEFVKLALQVIQSDRKQFKTHSDIYYQDPASAIRVSLNELQNNPKWKSNWDNFMEHMVYGEKLDYEEALQNLIFLSELIFDEMN